MRSRRSARLWRRKERSPGAPAARERGTVLLMVVGVLALLAIIAVVYAAIGQADRRTGSALVRSTQLEDISGQVAGYIADIIGKDVTTVVSEEFPGKNANTPLVRRYHVAWTYPGMPPDDDIRSNPPGNNTALQRFKPYGRGYQPWLAPIEPTRIGFNTGGSPVPWSVPDKPYLDYRDWLSISNVAPTGQFVNLANLRNNFFAEPGTGLDSRGRPRMSEHLGLFGNDAAGLPQANNPPLLDGRIANPDIPWHWTMYQRHAARPMGAFNTLAGQPGPAQNEYLDNQWADADGDGIADSRWCDLTSLVGTDLARVLAPELAQQDRARYFAAVRVVDTSGMINLNTATDLTDPPGPLPSGAVAPPPPAFPAGITPADIDVRRLLTQRDVYERYGGGYNLFQRPGNIMAAWDYFGYTNLPGSAVANAVGEAAYSSLFQARATGKVIGLGTPLGPPIALHPDQRVSQYLSSASDPDNSGHSELVYNVATGAGAVTTAAPFGLSEELELHAFFGVNDPRERSRLEAVLDGRSNKAPSIFPGFGVLRSNRPLDVERDRRGDNRANGQQDDDSLAQMILDLRHRVTTYQAARPLSTLHAPTDFDPKKIGDSEVRFDLSPYTARTIQQTPEALNRLFNAACDALMPYRGREVSDFTEDTWDLAGNPANAGLHYAHNPDIAFRAAAHWVANWLDSIDNDDSTDHDVSGPTVFTLRSVRNASTTSSPDFPWPQVTLDNAQNELATDRTEVESQLVNIYGIEAQPFLCEATSYAFWSDVPYNAQLLPNQNVDDEWTDANPGGPGQPGNPLDIPITIDGNVNYHNADFLGEILAFQVTNPFDRDIYLTRVGTTGANPDFVYYVEYAGHYFPLAQLDDSAAVGAFKNVDVKLKAGETRVFYATSPRTEMAFNSRFRVAGSSPTQPGSLPNNVLRAWVDHQFRKNPAAANQQDAMHIAMFDPATGDLVAPMGDNGGDAEQTLVDLHGEQSGATNAQRKVVKLWRILRAPNYDAVAGAPNDQTNDLLADRLRDPAVGPATLLQRMDITTDEVTGTHAGNDHTMSGGPFGGSDEARDNIGFSITLWGAIRRPTNPATATSVPRADSYAGAMPPWCIEAREDQDYGWSAGGDPGQFGGRRNLNKDFTGPGGRGDRGDYGGGQSAYLRIHALFQDQAEGDGGTKLDDQMREKAEDKKGNLIPLSQSRDLAGNFLNFNQQSVRIYLGGRNTAGTLINPGLYRRTGDLLLPMPVGPFFDPQLQTANPELERMTLSEVLALVTDYYSPPAGTLYSRAGHSDPAGGIRPAFDHGHFVIDDFVPFNDVNRNGMFDPGAGNFKERPLGLGIPMALNLLDKFRLDSLGGSSKGEIGRLNINSAPVLNQALLPLAAPDAVADWVTTDLPNKRTHIYDPATEQFDVATTLVAYRDKVDLLTRPRLTVTPGAPRVATPLAGSSVEISFRDTVDPLQNPWDLDGRRNRTAIPALREEPGFRSIGEILAARLQNVPASAPSAREYQSNSIDRFVHDVGPSGDPVSLKGQFGVESATLQTSIPTERVSDGIPDDYAEKIAVATAMLNTASVRSDTFCVWFIIRGYLPSDVEGLGPNDPMVPTVAKRFMMIVDRTNVVKDTDHPRILLLREVPL